MKRSKKDRLFLKFTIIICRYKRCIPSHCKAGCRSYITVIDLTPVLTKVNLPINLKKKCHYNKNLTNLIYVFWRKPTKANLHLGMPYSKRQATIFSSRDFAKSYNWTYCWTSYGKSYLRQKKEMPHIRIEEEADLARLKINTIITSFKIYLYQK